MSKKRRRVSKSKIYVLPTLRSSLRRPNKKGRYTKYILRFLKKNIKVGDGLKVDFIIAQVSKVYPKKFGDYSYTIRWLYMVVKRSNNFSWTKMYIIRIK